MLSSYSLKQGQQMAEDILRMKAAAEKKKKAKMGAMANSRTAATTTKKKSANKNKKAPRRNKMDSTVSSTVSCSSSSVASGKSLSPVSVIPRQVNLPKKINELSVSEHTALSNSFNSITGNQSQIEDSTMDFQDVIAINDSWAALKLQDGHVEEMGEEIFMQMVSANPAVREEIGVVSIRSESFGDLCQAFCEIVDVVVTLLGTTIEDEELQVLAKLCHKKDVFTINPVLFGNAVSAAVQRVLKNNSDGAFPENIFDLWSAAFQTVFAQVKELM